MDHDVLIVGGGIAGMESALTLGEMGYKVLLVEKQGSIGGKMILLSKVFPTLDCASCISTPKMASVAHHPNITVLTHTQVKEIEQKEDGSFRVRYHRDATYVDSAACTGCGECETACTVALSDDFNFGLVAHRAAHIPFPQAVPKKSEITRSGSSPCSATCPAGVKAHGYVSLVRSGKHEEAFHLHMEDAPLPGSLARTCYAPCESACTRGELEGTVSIRQIKRFMVDRYYAAHETPEYGPAEERTGKRVAIVGSGPAGLSAAYFLGRLGHDVTIFEAAEEAGGMLRYGIPAYRLPNDVVDRDIKNVTALGVEIRTNERVASLKRLERDGFDATFLATGTYETWSMGVKGEDLDGVMDCMAFLARANAGHMGSLEGKRVVVIGGGNSAIDPARLALRLGAAEVTILYRRSQAEMPAHDWEVEAALAEGVKLKTLRTPNRFVGDGVRLTHIESLTMKLGEPDESGRRRPVPVDGSEKNIPADIVVLAIGLRPATGPFSADLESNRDETIRVEPETLQTSRPQVFAGGDAVTGPSMIVNAIGQGKRAAFYIDRFMKGAPLEGLQFDNRLPEVAKDVILARGTASRRPPRTPPELPLADRLGPDLEVEGAFSEEDARASANRCMDCGTCSECQECVKACPSNAIDFSQRDSEGEEEINSVIVSTGFTLFDPHNKPEYGYGRHPNVITAMQMDRLIAPTKPFNATVRPSDGKTPDNIAFVLCTGSRDCTASNRLCSRVCCMYSIKQAQLIMGALPLADITIYYMDIRSFGKGYEEFYRQAEEMGVAFVKGKIASIDQGEDQNLVLHYEDIEGGTGPQEAEHDLVVLSVGLLPNPDALHLFKERTIGADEFDYVQEVDEDLFPTRTRLPGVFAAGAASAARDIPDTILHAGAAATQVAAYIERAKAVR